MSKLIDNCFITDPLDLNYISHVVNQVLESKHHLADIKDLQASLKEVSLQHGQEIQMNLVFEENQLSGFNFSVTNDSSKTTANIPFKQQQSNISSEKGDIISGKQTISSVVTQPENNITVSSPSSQKITITPGLQVEDQHIINPEQPENQTILKSSFSVKENINPDLINIANQLANQQEVNGLLLTGLPLKSSINLKGALQQEEQLDVQTAGLAILKRFEQVLPQEFIELKAGEAPKAFNWKDPRVK